MSYPVVQKQTVKQTLAGKPVVITNTYHSKNPEGLRTVRTHYLENMPHNAGGWLANTITETVINGTGKSKKTVIPEHRVA